jgi:prophage regulatory protein
MKHIHFMRKKVLLHKLPYSNSTLYRRVNEGLFPPPVTISKNVSAWVTAEVDAVVELLSTGASTVEIAELVQDLLESRRIRGGQLHD